MNQSSIYFEKATSFSEAPKYKYGVLRISEGVAMKRGVNVISINPIGHKGLLESIRIDIPIDKIDLFIQALTELKDKQP